MSSKENKPKMGLKKKISDVRYYLYTNREYRKILKDILFENMDIDTFKRARSSQLLEVETLSEKNVINEQIPIQFVSDENIFSLDNLFGEPFN